MEVNDMRLVEKLFAVSLLVGCFAGLALAQGDGDKKPPPKDRPPVVTPVVKPPPTPKPGN